MSLRKNKEEQFKTMIRASLDGFLITDVRGRFLEVNDAYCRLLGYSREELLTMGISDIAATGTAEDTARHMAELMETGNARFETRHRCKNGSILDVEVSSNYTQAYGGRIYCFLRDITERKRLVSALQESEEKFHSMSAHTKDALVMMDDEGNISFWNAAAEKLFGYSVQEVMGKELHTFIAPEKYYEAFKKVFGHFRETGEGAMIGKTRELMALRKGGAEFPVELSLASLKLKNKWHGVGLVRDITERKRSEDVLRESESRLKELFENLSSGVAVCQASPDGQNFTITAFNQAAERIENMPRTGALGKNVIEVFPDATESGLLKMLRRVWRSNVAEHLPVSSYHEGRITGWRENYVYKLPNGEVVVIYDDVTKSKQAEEKMHYLAHYDVLTGLPNRTLFSDRLQQSIATAKRDKTHLALIFLDLDKFKPVNDELGHDVGDMLLKEVAQRMQSCVRETDTVSRIGGDEFIVLLPTIEAELDAMRVAEKILHATNQPFELAGHDIRISSSIGIAVYPEHGDTEQHLIKNADIAMYYAKERRAQQREALSTRDGWRVARDAA